MMLIDCAIVAIRKTSVSARSQYPLSKTPPAMGARNIAATVPRRIRAARSGPDLGIKSLAEEPARAEHENRKQQAETDRIAITGIEQDRGEILDDADDQPGDQCARDAAEAAEDHDDEGLHRVGVAKHRGKGEIDGDQRAGSTCHRGAYREGDGIDVVDVDAD